jgi:hypothetical protein
MHRIADGMGPRNGPDLATYRKLSASPGLQPGPSRGGQYIY